MPRKNAAAKARSAFGLWARRGVAPPPKIIAPDSAHPVQPEPRFAILWGRRSGSIWPLPRAGFMSRSGSKADPER
jgi:hypothetical protein